MESNHYDFIIIGAGRKTSPPAPLLLGEGNAPRKTKPLLSQGL